MNNQQDLAGSLAELLTPAMQKAINKAFMRHHQLGESIVVMRDGEIVILTGDEIPVSELDSPNRSLNDNY